MSVGVKKPRDSAIEEVGHELCDADRARGREVQQPRRCDHRPRKSCGTRARSEFDHTAVAVLTKDASGKLQVERHDTTAKHLAWVGAALTVESLRLPLSGLSGAPGPVRSLGRFHHNIPKKDVEAIGELLESGQSGLIVVAVNKVGTDIEPLLSGAGGKTVVVQTVWGDLDAEIEKEIAKAQTDSSS